jgi:probable phosphoglycerate mutase
VTAPIRADTMKAEAWLLRHASTEWTHCGRHTGRTEIPLDAAGRDEARAAARVLATHTFDRVLVSPQTTNVLTSLVGNVHV